MKSGVVWCGAVWCGVAWDVGYGCGVVWCGVVERGVVWGPGAGVAWNVVECSGVWFGGVWVVCSAVWEALLTILPLSCPPVGCCDVTK